MMINAPIDGRDALGQLGLHLESSVSNVGDGYIAKGLVNAYSLSRKIHSTATNSFRVRRSSDSVQQDIGFDGNNVDNSGLTTFTGANDGLVVILYDQVSSLDLTESTAAEQVRIVNTGVIETLPTTSITTMAKVPLSSDAQYSSGGSSISAFSAFFLTSKTSTSTLEVGQNGTSERIFFRITNRRLRCRIDGSNNDAPTAVTDDVPYVVAMKWRASDGILISSINTVAQHNTTHAIGGQFTFQAVRFDAGSGSSFTELMYFNTFLSDSDFSTVASEMVNYYSLPSSI